jgi:AraC family transcriptional regulator
MNRTYQEHEYISRINRVIDHVQSNLDKKFTVDGLAVIACFSPFHFHRIFKAIIGETLISFIQRLRIEKAARLLVSNPKKSITEIAFDVGFSGSASFARLFKEFFNMSASEWRSGGYREFSKNRKAEGKIGKTKSKNEKETVPSSGYFFDRREKGGAADPGYDQKSQSKRRRSAMPIAKNTKITVSDLPAMTVAYVRHIGPYKGDSKLFENLWSRLMTWAGPRGLLQQPEMTCLSLYHDDPEVTDKNKLRVSVCLSVPPSTEVGGEIGKMEIAAGKYAIAHFEISPDEFQEAWDYVYGEWLPKSGYQPDDRPPFEKCCNDPAKHPQKKHIVDICVPVKPL